MRFNAILEVFHQYGGENMLELGIVMLTLVRKEVTDI